MNYWLQTHPFIVPAAGDKHIEEHFGRVATGHEQLSIARMEAPPGWSEPWQQPLFDEWTLVYAGRKQLEIDGETLVLQAGQSIWVKAGARVRYSNPFAEACLYWSICLPAFSPETVNRDAG